MLTVKFYVNGGLIETYRCESTTHSKSDQDNIIRIKYDIIRNFGYAPQLVWEAGVESA